MKIIGVTGGIGSGKTTVCEMFEKLGAEVIDADKIAHDITKRDGAAYAEIIDKFGEKVMLPDGDIDRKALAKIVFSDSEKLKMLEHITHKYVFEEMKKRMDKSTAPVVVLDVPLLFSSEFPFVCDLTVGVTADMEDRISRVFKRDNMTREEIISRINNQISDKTLKENADIIIENSSLDLTFEKVKEIFNKIRNE